MDRWNAVKMRMPDMNLPLGLLAKLVSREKNFEPIAGKTFIIIFGKKEDGGGQKTGNSGS